MTRHRAIGPALALLTVAGCFDDLGLDQLLDPPDPTFLDASAACSDGVMTYTALVESDVDVSNLVLERSGVDDEDLGPLFPTLELSANSGGVTRWALDVAHDCDVSVATTFTAWTTLETSAEATTAWPDVDLEGGGLQPAHGSDIGGSTVTLTGEQMDAITRVTFGGADATLVSATDDTLVVETPPGDVGSVDVTLEAGVTTVSLPEAFTYWPDATGQMSGLTRLVLQVYDTRWFNIASAYTTLSPYGPFAQHEVVVHVPDDPSRSFPNTYPAAGDCSVEHDFGWTKLSVGSYLTLTSDDLGALPLVASDPDTPNYYYVESDIDPADWSGQVFDLELVEGNAHMPPMVVPESALLPLLPETTSFDWQNADTVVFGDDLSFTWSTTSAQRVWWTVYPAQGTSALANFSCMSDATTGSLTIPWDQVTDGVDTARMTSFVIRLGFHDDAQVPLDHDNSAFWAIGEVNYWIYLSVVAE